MFFKHCRKKEVAVPSWGTETIRPNGNWSSMQYMCSHPSPSPLQFTGQCVTSTLGWLRSGQERSAAAPYSMNTDNTNPVKEKRRNPQLLLK